MGNTIPHGDRLHECSATCHEYKNGPMPGMKINYQHEDGRNCIIGPDGIWRHWDHPEPEPGPREAVDYRCLRDHPGAEMKVDLSSEPPSPLRMGWSDSSEFGMPTIGSPMRDMGMSLERSTNHTISRDGVSLDYYDQGEDIDAMTEQARRILGERLPVVMAHFLKRNAEYGEGAHVLGVKGQFADINRKVIKLKRYLWDDVPVPEGAESIEVIAGELIGHLLILIDEMGAE